MADPLISMITTGCILLFVLWRLAQREAAKDARIARGLPAEEDIWQPEAPEKKGKE